MMPDHPPGRDAYSVTAQKYDHQREQKMSTDSSQPRPRRVAAALAGRPAAAIWGRAAAALICLAALAACSSSSSSSTPPVSSSTSSPASPTASSAPATACANGSLQVKLGFAQGYAGGVDETIDFTNISGVPCTLYGYPGVSLVSGPQVQIGLAAQRDNTVPVTLITLAPGATGNAGLQIADALNYPTATCSPAKATDLRIYPPDQTAAVYLPDSSEGCAEPVQVLFVAAVQAGSGSS
jgi:hypothetical protein